MDIIHYIIDSEQAQSQTQETKNDFLILIMPIKTVVITGGNSGIGLSVTKSYLNAGDNVAVMSRSTGELEKLSLAFPQSLFFFEGDISDVQALESFYKKCVDRFTSIDILIANAGIANAIPVAAVSEDDYQKVMDTNVKGVFFTIQKSLSYLNSGASITLISSIQAEKGAGLWALYGASKAAVRSLTRSFAAELGHQNIRVNCVSPGVTDTPIFDKFGFDDATLETMLDNITSSVPLGRLAEPQEIASTIAFINSADASYITGADIQVDGGLIQV